MERRHPCRRLEGRLLGALLGGPRGGGSPPSTLLPSPKPRTNPVSPTADHGSAKTKSVEPARKSSVSGQSWGMRPATADPQPDGVAMYWRPATE